jgi:hypothetical protein
MTKSEMVQILKDMDPKVKGISKMNRQQLSQLLLNGMSSILDHESHLNNATQDYVYDGEDKSAVALAILHCGDEVTPPDIVKNYNI